MKSIVQTELPDLTNLFKEKISDTRQQEKEFLILSVNFLLPDEFLMISPLTFFNQENLSFYLSNPNSNEVTAASGNIYSVSFELSNLRNEIQIINEKYFTSYNSNFNYTVSLPLYLTTIEFPSNNNSHSVWYSLRGNRFFIPEISFYKNSVNAYATLNFKITHQSDAESLQKNFENNFNIFFNSYGNIEEFIPKINLIEFNNEEKSNWILKVNKAIELIKNGAVNKIVLSRMLKVILSDKLNPILMLKYLSNVQDNSFLFYIMDGGECYLGASPERLFTCKNNIVSSDAIAGTKPRGINEVEDKLFEGELAASEKDRLEQKLVADFIVNVLKNYCDEIKTTGTASIKKYKAIQHLYTGIEARLKEKSSIFDLMISLFPTPAVCGYPKEKAHNFINELEDYKRGLYSGLIGWINANIDADFIVAIRSALILNNELYLFAGSGLVADSNPQKEFEETSLKMNTILSLFDNAGQ